MSSAPVKAWTKFVLRQAMRDATVIVAPVHELDGFGAEELAGKTIITSTVNDGRIAQFRKKGVNMVVDGAPAMFDHVLSPSLLDAMIIAATEKAGGRDPRGRLSGDHHQPRAGAAHHLSQRLQARQPVRVRHPSAVAGVFQEHQAHRAALPRVPAHLHGHAGEGDGLRASVRLFEGDGHQVAHRRGSRRLADFRGRNAPRNHEPQPRVHLPPPARRRPDRQEPRRADHGPRRIHQGGRRCGAHRVQARAAAHHHRQQLQRLRGAVGRARCRAAPGPGARADARPESAVQGDGGGRHRGHRLGLRPPAGDGRRGGLPGVPRDRQAALAQGVDPEGDPRRQAVPVLARRQGHRRHGHDRDRDLGRGQEGPRHHAGQAGLRDHRRGPPARSAARGSGQAPGRAGDRIRRDPAARAGVDEEHRAAEERRLRLPGRNHRPRAGGALRELHRRPQHRVGEGAGDLPSRPQARHEARGHFRRQRAVLRRRHSPRAQAGARRARQERATSAKARAPKKRDGRPPHRNGRRLVSA